MDTGFQDFNDLKDNKKQTKMQTASHMLSSLSTMKSFSLLVSRLNKLRLIKYQNTFNIHFITIKCKIPVTESNSKPFHSFSPVNKIPDIFQISRSGNPVRFSVNLKFKRNINCASPTAKYYYFV